MFKALIPTLALLLIATLVQAQELNCKVTINHDKITGVAPEVFTAMQRAVVEFMNNRKWTTDEFAVNERIDCNILITLTGNKLGGDPDVYSATMSIQSARPVFNTTYTTAMCNHMDRDVAFKFNQFSPLQFDDNRVTGTEAIQSNLTAILAYYAYIIIGLDYDSYSLNGGSTYFKRAQNVVNNAPEQGKSISGWKAVEGTRNRYWLVDQLLNARFQDFRNYWYSMHREGLDSMYARPTEGRLRVLAGLKKVYQVNRENPSSMLMQFFFTAKNEELLHLLAQTPKAERGPYLTLLLVMDVPNAAKYNALK
ncbi:MAG: DUF4835 family protein [Chitinophagia bacterium]|nr:DUF4835 family protein [Chitinophagia bacterium]